MLERIEKFYTSSIGESPPPHLEGMRSRCRKIGESRAMRNLTFAKQTDASLGPQVGQSWTGTVRDTQAPFVQAVAWPSNWRSSFVPIYPMYTPKLKHPQVWCVNFVKQASILPDNWDFTQTLFTIRKGTFYVVYADILVGQSLPWNCTPESTQERNHSCVMSVTFQAQIITLFGDIEWDIVGYDCWNLKFRKANYLLSFTRWGLTRALTALTHQYRAQLTKLISKQNTRWRTCQTYSSSAISVCLKQWRKIFI